MTSSESDSGIKLKTIKDIVDSKDVFSIPDYQRGYRWEKCQVLDLLNDLDQFFNGEKNGFYCLQPLVVVKSPDPAPSNKTYTVVDGQQRLTTLFLILQRSSPDDNLFTIQYERHKDKQKEGNLAELLKSDAMEEKDGPDFHYLRQAKTVIDDFFKGKTLSDDWSKLARHEKISFIWYELGSNEDAIEAFARLNAGKIQLTDTELIRALFLRDGNDISEAERLQMAQAWDQMERRLQDPEFWSFCTNPGYHPENRIEFILSLEYPKVSTESKDHELYRKYHEQLEKPLGRRSAWEEIEKRFFILEDCYQDDDLFHLVGFLTTSEIGVKDIFGIWDDEKADRQGFQDLLKKKIKENLLKNGDISTFLDELTYDKRKEVKKTLLCFNLATLMNDRKGTVRFSFSSFRDQSWDVEHIHANASVPPSGEVMEETLRAIEKYLEVTDPSSDLLQDLKKPYSETSPKDREDLYQRCIEKLEEKAPPQHGIGNLTLLHSEMNRGYGNAPFQVKRQWILGNDNSAFYILPCTRHVFTKTYSQRPDLLRQWGDPDAKDYQSQIGKTLVNFFTDRP